MHFKSADNGKQGEGTLQGIRAMAERAKGRGRLARGKTGLMNGEYTPQRQGGKGEGKGSDR